MRKKSCSLQLDLLKSSDVNTFNIDHNLKYCTRAFDQKLIIQLYFSYIITFVKENIHSGIS